MALAGNKKQDPKKQQEVKQDTKHDVQKQFARHEKDTGSPEVQVALLTRRINDLTKHLKDNPKDFSCRRGLMKLVGQRRRLQNYYKVVSRFEQYKDLITKLKLRK